MLTRHELRHAFVDVRAEAAPHTATQTDASPGIQCGRGGTRSNTHTHKSALKATSSGGAFRCQLLLQKPGMPCTATIGYQQGVRAHTIRQREVESYQRWGRTVYLWQPLLWSMHASMHVGRPAKVQRVKVCRGTPQSDTALVYSR